MSINRSLHRSSREIEICGRETIRKSKSSAWYLLVNFPFKVVFKSSQLDFFYFSELKEVKVNNIIPKISTKALCWLPFPLAKCVNSVPPVVVLIIVSSNIVSTQYFLLVSQSFPVNPSTQIHLYPFSWYNGIHFPVFLQEELSQEDYTKESIRL